MEERVRKKKAASMSKLRVVKQEEERQLLDRIVINLYVDPEMSEHMALRLIGKIDMHDVKKEVKAKVEMLLNRRDVFKGIEVEVQLP
jgi:hypothetical protein